MKLLLLCSIGFLISCSPLGLDSENSDTALEELRFDSDAVGEATLLESEYRRLSGQPLSGIHSAVHFRLTAHWAFDQSVVKIHSHTSGFDYHDGIEITLRREDQDLFILLSTPQRTEIEIEKFEDFFSNGELQSVALEIQNGIRDGMRLLIWKEDMTPQSARPQTRDFYSVTNADVDSKGRVFSSPGRGIFFGFEIRGVPSIRLRRHHPHVLEMGF